ncbi:hypothetical protein DLD82_17665 [Methanospirillum stamsii]|uniref:Uncharacterized protein n=1 Tax=Methanospirillum stamsii TaxID=1277351 RepID=A0A2V2MMS8_9EURY|nr:hypothetical protein DLD82_17665 [Methanospirillum stamsii]
MSPIRYPENPFYGMYGMYLPGLLCEISDGIRRQGFRGVFLAFLVGVTNPDIIRKQNLFLQ